ncbi:TPA: hypothetical protein ACFOIN_002147, partial [Neisseria meningitidis]
QLKIFWRIFMRQISLTDYFCKGLTICANQAKNAKYRLKIFQTVFAVFIAVFLPYPDFCLGLKQIGSQIAIKE